MTGTHYPLTVPRAVLLANSILIGTRHQLDIPRLQTMIREGTLPGYQDERGRWWTSDAAVRQWARALKAKVQQ